MGLDQYLLSGIPLTEINKKYLLDREGWYYPLERATSETILNYPIADILGQPVSTSQEAEIVTSKDTKGYQQIYVRTISDTWFPVTFDHPLYDYVCHPDRIDIALDPPYDHLYFRKNYILNGYFIEYAQSGDINCEPIEISLDHIQEIAQTARDIYQAIRQSLSSGFSELKIDNILNEKWYEYHEIFCDTPEKADHLSKIFYDIYTTFTRAANIFELLQNKEPRKRFYYYAWW